MSSSSKKAVILLSGGLDSTTCLAIAKQEGYDCYALSFSYGQRHNAELAAAQRIAKAFNVIEHKIISLDTKAFSHSALTDKNQDVPEYQGKDEIPSTYVPARNTIFLSYALGYAEVLNASVIVTGVTSVDYSGYPDCRPEYIAAFQQVANLATKAAAMGDRVTIYTPLILLSKVETIKKGIELGVDYSLTVSCYQANMQGEACGRCDSCHYRREGFLKVGIADPTRYI